MAHLGWRLRKCKYGYLKHRRGARICKKRKSRRKSRR